MRISDWSADVGSSDLARAQALISQNKLDYPVSLPATQHKTRQQVVAELARAKAAGQISTNRLDYPVASSTTASKSRSEVVNQLRSEEHTSELQSLMRISYAVFCLKKKINNDE